MVPERIVILVIDGGGAGAASDAEAYGDLGSNTLGHAWEPGLRLPNLERLGLDRILGHPGPEPRGAFGRMRPRALGKDTISGHWEMMESISPVPFRTFPAGFPPEVMQAFEGAIGRGTLGNRAASGTEIIAELGAEHLRTGRPIVYTSADSVFQIAAHEAVVPLEQLYDWCERARAIMQGPNQVGRVIARPFRGEPGAFERTPDRRDYALSPPGQTVLDVCLENKITVTGIGKIGDIFAHRGLSEERHTRSDAEGLAATVDLLQGGRRGLLFVNLVDFDTKYGHRRDLEGYRRNLAAFDEGLGLVLAALGSRDVLAITADHGCDPTHSGSDHTRENVPLLVTGEGLRTGDLGLRESLADLGATVAEAWGLVSPGQGQSFWPWLSRGQETR